MLTTNDDDVTGVFEDMTDPFGIFANVAISVTENNNPDFTPISVTCKETVSNTAIADPENFVANLADVIECTFVNEKKGSLKITKIAPTQTEEISFFFEVSGGVTTIGEQEIELSTITMVTIDRVVAANDYMMEETIVPTFWILDPTNPPFCTLEGGASTGTIDGGNPKKINGITVEPGKTTECTFTNLPPGILTIFKDITPFEDLQDFNFELNGASDILISAFTLDDDGGSIGIFGGDDTNLNFATFLLPANQLYTAEETLPDEFWELIDIQCETPPLGSVITKNVASNFVQVDLKPGDDVECTFRNQSDFPTRTQGFYKTHTDITLMVRDPVVSPIIIGVYPDGYYKVINSWPILFGAWEASPGKMAGPADDPLKGNEAKRFSPDPEKIRLLHQLLAAIYNCVAFGCPQPIQQAIIDANIAWSTGDTAALIALATFFDGYNNGDLTSGSDLGACTVCGIPGASPKVSKAYANAEIDGAGSPVITGITVWDNLGGEENTLTFDTVVKGKRVMKGHSMKNAYTEPEPEPEPTNQAPIANAGANQLVTDADKNGVETVTLDGTGSSDSDGTITSYEWKEGVTVLGSTSTITLDLATGGHTITLTVTDDDGATSTDTVEITVEEVPNQAPIANAGANQQITDSDGNGVETVTLDGTGSSDPDGTISYEWKEGATVLGSTATITLDLATRGHEITLTVTDDKGATSIDTVTINVKKAPKAPK